MPPVAFLLMTCPPSLCLWVSPPPFPALLGDRVVVLTGLLSALICIFSSSLKPLYHCHPPLLRFSGQQSSAHTHTHTRKKREKKKCFHGRHSLASTHKQPSLSSSIFFSLTRFGMSGLINHDESTHELVMPTLSQHMAAFGHFWVVLVHSCFAQHEVILC